MDFVPSSQRNVIYITNIGGNARVLEPLLLGFSSWCLCPRRQSEKKMSANAEFFDEAQNVRGGNIVEGMFVFLLQAFPQIFGGDVAGFAIR